MPSMLSLFSRSHRRSPTLLLLVATSLSISAICPPSQFSLSSCSHRRPTATTLPPPLSSPHPTALSLPRHHRLSSPSLPHLHRWLLPPSWSIPLPPPLSLFFAALRSPPRRPFVSDLGIRKNLHDFEARRPQPCPPPPHVRSSVPSLFSASASAPSSLIDATNVASFIAASPPPTKTSHRPPFSSPPSSAATTVDLSRRWASTRGRRWCLPRPSSSSASGLVMG